MTESKRQDVGDALRHVALKDSTTPDAIDRVWRRLEDSIELHAPSERRPSVISWAVAAAAVTFGLGIWVGRGSVQPVEIPPVVYAEPPSLERAASLTLRRRAEPASEPLLEEEAEPIAPESERRPLRRAVTRTKPATSAPVRPSELASQGATASSAVELERTAARELDEEVVRLATAREAERAVAAWRRLADSGEYAAALDELGRMGGFEATIESANAEQLLLLVDVARATGQHTRAVAALRRIMTDFPSDPEAPLAAWSLGNLLEKVGDKRGALEAFAVYRSLSPQGDFAEDALVRELKSAVDNGERASAAQLAAQYEGKFPGGRRAVEVRALLALALGAGADAGAPESVERGEAQEVEEPSAERSIRPSAL